MLAGAALRKTGIGWEFASEAALEDFVWDNLQQLSGLKPLKRQYAVKGEICDILALNNTRQLVILELKNTEDRYVVQQLTRYYDNLLDEKPFQEQIDYNQPVRLIAIAPSFHRHNLIDRKHTKLIVDFLQVTVAQINQNFHLQLQDIDTNQTWSIPIPYQELDISSTSSNIPEPPQLLLDWLGACTGEEQQAILKLREKIISFDGRIKEEFEGKNTIRYGRGKSKPVAEICYQISKSKPSKAVVFLRLPTPTSWRKEVIGRIRLWLDGSVVTHVGHVPEGFGKMKLQSEWDAMPREKRPGNYYHNKYSALNATIYNKFLQKDYNDIITLESLADLSLSKWLARI
ncbi:endonuclease NucS domain-containing protein [Nostoc sp. 'Peltigera membranacea cyanobiont' N6]|uniref:endonuclease NucS domain-containing protein n=1 Tax=Nostoc sp. 'Peltigera membranacea cyanobiont' N6 TaxID=1261031 RepID=UPI000CF32749|nr:endonuclease NucS domain-containing protein [Nostoc sp. 'Peltigera membranacea cyanobiont' N6]AVH68635.1 RecB family nuclease [Nostoc sp. 'Peltigera membranacea cyanobiont' N6]